MEAINCFELGSTVKHHPDAAAAFQAKCNQVVITELKARGVPFDAFLKAGMRVCNNSADGIDRLKHSNVESFSEAFHISNHANLLQHIS